nr:endoglucanase 2-like [Ipomoea batatas]
MGRRSKSSKGNCCGWVLLALVALAIGCAIYVLMNPKEAEFPDPEPGPPGKPIKKYAHALKVALEFFDVQKAGKLDENKIPWRGNSALKDGSQAKLDLSKGMYDAGDTIKFGFPMAYTASVLSWAILEYGDQMEVAKQLEPAQDSLKWIMDFLVNAHPSPNVLYIQVGDPKSDHKCWEKPESITKARPLIQVNTSAPGTEVAAETSAAMAAASLVFKSSDSDYSALLLKHAKELFAFAEKHRASYSKSIPQVAAYYNSTGYGDELLWAATWLYHATGDEMYYDFATGDDADEFVQWGSPTWFSWDDKFPGAQVLMSRVSFFKSKGLSNSVTLEKYKSTAEAVMCGLLPKSPTATSSRTDSGLIWVSEWNALQHSVASAFLAVVYSDYMRSSRTARITCDGKQFTPYDLRDFATSQADYVLGDNPMEMSYLVGYGDKYPEYVHHRGASIPAKAKPGCKQGFKWLDSSKPNPNVAVGALVGGPFLNDTYVDARNNSMQGEPTTYNSALLVGLLSGLVTTSSVVKSFV